MMCCRSKEDIFYLSKILVQPSFLSNFDRSKLILKNPHTKPSHTLLGEVYYTNWL